MDYFYQFLSLYYFYSTKLSSSFWKAASSTSNPIELKTD